MVQLLSKIFRLSGRNFGVWRISVSFKKSGKKHNDNRRTTNTIHRRKGERSSDRMFKYLDNLFWSESKTEMEVEE
ncbi:OLC1v1005960C1, partial [Oldenlandia corymbosa var. corymbosa]